MIGSPWALCNKYYNLDDNAVVFYSLFVLLRPGGYGPICILQELKRGTGWEWLHNTLTESYYLKYGEEWKTTELSENWNSCGKVNLWWASCIERERGVTFVVTKCGIIVVGLAVTMVMVVKETKIHLVFVKYRYRVPFKLLFLIDLS